MTYQGPYTAKYQRNNYAWVDAGTFDQKWEAKAHLVSLKSNEVKVYQIEDKDGKIIACTNTDPKHLFPDPENSLREFMRDNFYHTYVSMFCYSPFSFRLR